MRERKTSVLRACRVPNPANRLNVVHVRKPSSSPVFRQWPQGYDPLAKGEKPYQPRPDDREAHGKLALPPLKDPTPHKDGDGNGSH